MSRHTRLVIIAGSLAGLAVLTRYAGLPLLIVGLVALRRQPRHAALFAALGVGPVGVWLARNYILTDTLMGSRLPSIYSPLEVVSHYVQVVGVWGIQIGVLCACAAAVVYLFQRLHGRVQHDDSV